jgi:hypothetical protein
MADLEVKEGSGVRGVALGELGGIKGAKKDRYHDSGLLFII